MSMLLVRRIEGPLAEESALPEGQEVADGAFALKPLAAVRASGTRGATATTSLEVPSDALVEIELDNGVTLWRRADTTVDSPEAGVRGIGAERRRTLDLWLERHRTLLDRRDGEI